MNFFWISVCLAFEMCFRSFEYVWVFHRGRCVEVALRGRCAAFQREFHLWRKQDLSTNKEHRFSTTRSDRIDDDNTVIFSILSPPPPSPILVCHLCDNDNATMCVCVYSPRFLFAPFWRFYPTCSLLDTSTLYYDDVFAVSILVRTLLSLAFHPAAFLWSFSLRWILYCPIHPTTSTTK